MRSTLKLTLALAAICVLALSVAWADVPQNMGVQGRLTDSAGDPVAPGLKIFTFKIFDAEVGGTEIWPGGAGEDQTLSTDVNGLWHANVGANIALTEAVFADTSRWLEVTVDDGINPAETLPRMKLSTNPWAHQAVNAALADHAATADNATTADQAGDASTLGGQSPSEFARSTHLHSPSDISPQGSASGLDADMLDGAELTTIQAEIDSDIAAHAVSTDHDPRYVNLAGDLMGGTLMVPEISVGASGIDGRFELWDGGAGVAVMVADHFGVLGGYLHLYDVAGLPLILSEPDGDGDGGFFTVKGGGTSPGFTVDGNYAASGDPFVSIAGSSSHMFFNTGTTGTGSVTLPDNAIDTSEIADEPGIASANSFTTVSLNSSMQDIETVEITIPAGGYIVVEGDCTGRTSGTLGRSQAYIQIDETSGGGTNIPHTKTFGLAGNASIVSFSTFPIHVSRVYQKSSSGTYTFRLEAMTYPSNGVGANVSCADPTLTAVYYPTSYGFVLTAVSAAEAGEFPSARAVNVDATDPDAPRSGELLYEVDLRDLELKAARANAEAERANRELMEARLNNDQLRPATNPEQ